MVRLEKYVRQMQFDETSSRYLSSLYILSFKIRSHSDDEPSSFILIVSWAIIIVPEYAAHRHRPIWRGGAEASGRGMSQHFLRTPRSHIVLDLGRIGEWIVCMSGIGSHRRLSLPPFVTPARGAEKRKQQSPRRARVALIPICPCRAFPPSTQHYRCGIPQA